RRPAGNHSLGCRRFISRALPEGPLANRAIRDRRWTRFLQRRRLCLDRSEPVSGREILRSRSGLASRQVAVAQHATRSAIWILGGAAVAPAFRREDQTDGGISAATFRQRYLDRRPCAARWNGAA